MLMSGKTWFHVDTASLKDAKLLPELLQENGYVTFGTGKWHNGQPSWLRAFQRRTEHLFRRHVGSYEGACQGPRPGRQVDRSAHGRKVLQRVVCGYRHRLPPDPRSQKPFFAYVAFTVPHDPRMPPLAFREMYYRNRPPLPDNFLPQHPFDNGMMQGGRDENLGALARTESIMRDQLAEYYGAITHLDGQVGRILEALQQTGQADKTLILYAADQGLAMGSHGLLGKQSVYEHSMRCPLIFAGPGVPQGKSTRPSPTCWMSSPHCVT